MIGTVAVLGVGLVVLLCASVELFAQPTSGLSLRQRARKRMPEVTWGDPRG